MRKGFDALCGVVRSEMHRNPLSGEVFIFMNRTRNTVKILRWESGGLVIYHKRLEQGRFEQPVYSNSDKTYHLQWTELVMIIQGISMKTACKEKDIKYAKTPINKGIFACVYHGFFVLLHCESSIKHIQFVARDGSFAPAKRHTRQCRDYAFKLN